jgi:hypothetical protein
LTGAAALKTRALLALSLVSFASYASAQTQLGTLFGTVTDTSGSVVPGAEVTIVNTSIGLELEGRTDTKGEYQMTGLPSPLALGGNGDAIFKDAAGDLADNVGRIFSTVDTARQIQLGFFSKHIRGDISCCPHWFVSCISASRLESRAPISLWF